MSKLFDRTDCAWELDQIDRAEQEAQRTLNGFQLAAMDSAGRSERLRGMRGSSRNTGVWEKERVATRMKLLKTGQLMSDLRVAMALFKACPHCTESAGKRH